jgi:membrane protein YdbS with pleckstrin-like domain
MSILPSATMKQFPLSKKKIVKKTVSSLLGIGIILFIIWLGAFLMWIGKGTLGGMFLTVTVAIDLGMVVLIVLTYLYQRWYFNTYSYDLTNDFVTIKKGPITPGEITIPYQRIQDVYVDQDVFDRLFGIYDVHLSSATISSGMEAHIDGVEKAHADGLKMMLLETVQQKMAKKA